MKVIDVVNATPVVQSLIGTKMSFGTAYRIKKIVDEVAVVSEQFEARRKELLDEYGTLSEDETQYEFPEDEKRTAFEDAMSEILEEDVDLDIKKVSIDALDGVDIEPANIALIEFMIDIEG